jgi:hypothetical protein
MLVTTIGQYRCGCSWVLSLNPISGTLACANPQCENVGKEFVAPEVELTEVAPPSSA